MQKNEIHVTGIVDFANGFSIGLTDHGGSIPDGTNKDGGRKIVSFAARSALLSGSNDEILCGPIDYRAVRAAATEIVCGNDRACTAPGITLMLAVALLAAMHALDLVVPEAVS